MVGMETTDSEVEAHGFGLYQNLIIAENRPIFTNPLHRLEKARRPDVESLQTGVFLRTGLDQGISHSLPVQARNEDLVPNESVLPVGIGSLTVDIQRIDPEEDASNGINDKRRRAPIINLHREEL